MSNEDMANILQILHGNLSDFASIPDRTHQGVLNHLMLTKLMRGAFIDHPAATVNGTIVIDPSRAYYWGISLGGVLVLDAKPSTWLVKPSSSWFASRIAMEFACRDPSWWPPAKTLSARILACQVRLDQAYGAVGAKA